MTPHVLRFFSLYCWIFNEGNILNHLCCMKWKAFGKTNGFFYANGHLSNLLSRRLSFFAMENGNDKQSANFCLTFAWNEQRNGNENAILSESFSFYKSFQTFHIAVTIFSAASLASKCCHIAELCDSILLHYRDENLLFVLSAFVSWLLFIPTISVS